VSSVVKRVQFTCHSIATYRGGNDKTLQLFGTAQVRISTGPILTMVRRTVCFQAISEVRLNSKCSGLRKVQPAITKANRTSQAVQLVGCRPQAKPNTGLPHEKGPAVAGPLQTKMTFLDRGEL
jgi:hypothetical protein